MKFKKHANLIAGCIAGIALGAALALSVPNTAFATPAHKHFSENACQSRANVAYNLTRARDGGMTEDALIYFERVAAQNEAVKKGLSSYTQLPKVGEGDHMSQSEFETLTSSVFAQYRIDLTPDEMRADELKNCRAGETLDWLN